MYINLDIVRTYKKDLVTGMYAQHLWREYLQSAAPQTSIRLYVTKNTLYM